MPKGKNGDIIIVTDSKRNLYNIEMTIIADKLHDEYAQYYDSDIVVAEDFNSNTYILKDEEYRLKYNSPEEFKKTFDNVNNKKQVNQKLILIKPKQRDKGTRRLIYPVIECHKNGYSFIDDNEKKRTYPKSSVEFVKESDHLNMIIELQEQIHELRQLVVQSLELATDDIQRKLDEFKS